MDITINTSILQHILQSENIDFQFITHQLLTINQ